MGCAAGPDRGRHRGSHGADARSLGRRRRTARGRRPFLPPRGGLRHVRRRGDQPPLERRGHQERRRPREPPAGAAIPPRELDRGLRPLPRPLPRGHVRRRPEARRPLLANQVRVGEARSRADSGAMARVPPGNRRGSLPDGGDGQDRRALLLLQGDPAAAERAAAVDAGGGAGGRQDQHRAGRLRRGGDGPHRTSGRPRRAGVPPDGSEPEERGPGDQRVRPRGARARGDDADRPSDDERGAEAGAQDDLPAAARQAHHRPGAGRLRHPARGAHVHRLPERLRLSRHAACARGHRHLGAGAGGVRRSPVGPLGAEPGSGPLQGPLAERRDRGQGGRDHGRLQRHRRSARAACRRGRRDRGAGGPLGGQAERGEVEDRGGGRYRSCPSRQPG